MGILDHLKKRKAELEAAQSARSMSGETRQRAIAYDALSEGPIEGLVNGAASVFLDGVSLVNTDIYKKTSAINTTASVSAGSTTVTVATGALDFADVEDGTRKILIKGAGKQGTNVFSATAGTTTLTTSSNWFTSGMASGRMHAEGASRIQVEGAGPDGRPYIGYITAYTSETSVQVHPPIGTTVSNASGAIDLVSVIASYNVGSNQVTTTTAATTTVSGVAATLTAPQTTRSSYANSSPPTNYEGVQYSFRSGTGHQRPIQMLNGGNPTASFVHAPNTRMQQNLTFDSTNGVSDTIITSANVGVPNAAETDEIMFVIEMPQLFAISTKSATEYNSWVEFTCDFEYSRDGGSSYTTHRLVGPSDATILNRAGGYEYFNDRSALSLHDGFIINKTKKAFQEPYLFNVEEFKPFDTWRLRFQRVNEPNKPQEHHDNMNESFIKFVEARITDKFSYPYTAIGAVSFNAKDFSGQPKRGYHIKGKKIQVPTNYLTRDETDSNSASYKRDVSDGSTESTYQDWDGNFRGDASTFAVSHVNHEKVYCNNPAWIFYDIITDPRYGLGDLITENFIDKYALYQIARYCDELVDDGKGGQEPRFTCNAYISKATEAYKVLRDLSGVFRGMLYWMDGQLVAVQDRPKEPIYTFTQANVIDGEFNYEGTAERIRKNQIVVKWNDPEDQFAGKSHIVDDVDNIIDTGRINSANMSAFGCTSEGQAHRLGKWRLLTDKIETEVCTFSTSVNAAFIRPGDIINIQDHHLDSVQFSGRIKAGTSTTIVTLDRAVTLAANTTYTLHLIYPTGGAYLEQDAATINSTNYTQGDLVLLDEDGAAIDTHAKASNVKDDSNNEVILHWSEHSRVEKQTISTSAGTIAAGSNITVSSAFSAAPNSEVIWALTAEKNDTEVTGSAKQYRVLGIDEESAGEFTIAASFYDDKKYDIVEKDYKVTPAARSEVTTLDNTNIARQADTVPGPDSLTFSIQQVAGTDTPADNEESLTGSLKAVIEWEMPGTIRLASNVVASSFVNEPLDKTETTITLGAAATTSTGYGIIERGTSNEEIIYWTAKSGSNITAVRGSLGSTAKTHATGVSFTEMASYVTPYPNLAYFEVEHSFGANQRTERFITVEVPGSQTSLEIPNVLGGTHNVRVRTVSNSGATSQWTAFENTVKAPSTVKATSKGNLAVGGTMTSPISITTAGAYNISNSTYTFTDASGEEYNITQTDATHAQRTQSFSGLSASNGVGYAVFDCSASASDPWKALDQKTDTTFHAGGESTAGSFTWWKEVGASNIGLTVVSGTITVSENSNTITGSSTSFSSDFAVGDMIRLGSTNDYAENTAAWYGYVDKVVSDTSLLVRGVVTKAFSGKYAYKQSFKPDFAKDTIVSKITRTASSAYLLEHFGSIPGLKGDDGATGSTGATGAAGIRTANGYLYYNTLQASAPSAPSNSSVTYNFSTGLLSGGVIGTGSTNWNQAAPASSGGQSSSKMWYVYWVVSESSAGSGSGTPTLGSTVYNAHNFVGLVRFSGTNTLVDGAGTSTTALVAGDLGSTGSTTIDGGRITTGTVAAARISISGKDISDLNNDEGFTDDTVANTKTTASAAATAANSAAKTGGSVGGWSLSSTTITSGNITLDNANTRIVISD